MTKDEKSFLSIFRIFLDGIAIIVAWFLSYYFRFESFIPGGQPGLLAKFSILSLPVSIFFLYIFYRNGVYESLRFKTSLEEMKSLFTANTLSFLSMVILIYFFG
ncbi:MAG: hypothetical protein HQK53_19755, partial [Oligoflexia bacterium]|nr:hypothetical protein [Oligoflexia bacterium]